jgi:wyosine [tRNA(Phe)-imidazoG37] synthetase (radical SAM superfamily)
MISVSFFFGIYYYFPMARFVFGPVPSRRLGFSLGVDILPRKWCTFDCIYCQIGKTTNKEVERKGFFDPQEIVKEVLEGVGTSEQSDFITFSGSGEPTLNLDLGWIIKEIKRKTDLPIAVITNGSLLMREDVRLDLHQADVVLPSLDGASDEVFNYIDRPHPAISLTSVVDGLKRFGKEFKGKIWLEIMVIKHINDTPEELEKFHKLLGKTDLDRIQLNTVARPPGEEIEQVMEASELETISRLFGPKCEVIGEFHRAPSGHNQGDWTQRILDVLKRRSLSLDDIRTVTGISAQEARGHLRTMEEKGWVRSFRFGKDLFYSADPRVLSEP